MLCIAYFYSVIIYIYCILMALFALKIEMNLFYLLNLKIIIGYSAAIFTFVAPMSRFYYPDAWHVINAYIIIIFMVCISVWALAVCA